ncbi:tRNA synthetases class I, catalytic domain-containing protein [Gorgonomyces haynaldii]|nr:tRNA synthetases class I, catalytic domain-containing protein [Gorgonomyces haynaldii]
MGSLFYQVASTGTKETLVHYPLLAQYIASSKLTTQEQITAAIKYLTKPTVDIPEFERECGVGVVLTVEDVVACVERVFESRKQEILEKRYQLLGNLIISVKNELKWANALVIKEQVDKHILALLGPKDERDNPKAKKPEQKQEVKPLTVAEMAKSSKFVFEGELARMHKPGENPQLNPEIMKAHLKRTGGRVVTRFPPEPNGFLHIGHAKAININFGFANAHNGITYLRYDDTNPEAEEKEYFDAILDMVQWLGYKPHAITYSSDHFQHLYDLAVELIKRDKAYICHCTGEQIHEQRGGDNKGPRFNCPHRDRPIQESVREFERMKNGEYKVGEAILRMKMDMQNPNPQFWDLVAYRVMFAEHIRTKNDWCIYPTYDYTHCLCDSFEDITHSFCTTEFTLSRESYYWLVDALELYKPVQWESGRLNISYTVMSKRKLNKLVTDKIVNGWDDPRLYTLAALKRRGFTPEAINAFARELGVTTAVTTVPPERLENYVRDHLNQVAPRLFLLLEPLKVTLVNVPDDFLLTLTVPNKPKDESLGERVLPFTKTFYIDQSDFRTEDDPNYYRLAPGKTVGLLNVPGPIKAVDYVTENGRIVEVKAEYIQGEFVPPKTYIQWVAESPKHKSPVKVEVRLVSKLFMHANPASKEEVPNGWLSDINPDSMQVVEGMIDTGILAMKVEDKFQGVRVGYFCVDKDTNQKIVLNRTVTLKEDSKKDK